MYTKIEVIKVEVYSGIVHSVSAINPKLIVYGIVRNMIVVNSTAKLQKIRKQKKIYFQFRRKPPQNSNAYTIQMEMRSN